MPSMGIYSWELITEYKIQNLIRIGTAGSFHEDIKIKDLVVGVAASTDSNYIHAFNVPGTYAPCASYKLLSKVRTLPKSGTFRLKRETSFPATFFMSLETGGKNGRTWEF